jgi:hypothetical protein
MALRRTPAEVVLSGPDSDLLQTLAEDIRAQLASMPQVAQAWVSSQPGLDEIWVEPDRNAFEAFGLTIDQVLPVLQLAGREGERMQTGFLLPSGRELPLVVERRDVRRERGASADLARLRVQTDAGVVPVTALASMRRMPPPTTIVHHNGRRELSVYYRLANDVPATGPSRTAIERQIADTVRAVPRPGGVAVEIPDQDETTSWFRRILVPVVLLLFLVLAMTFESLTMPVLVLLALPLTVLGATWALLFAGMGLDVMAMLGALALFGLTVNPAILIVDRMQQFVRAGGWSSGAAALAAVRERTRPVLMTTATTIAALWPLALTTGRENEIWPPFATIVIGGLLTSTVLTLLVVPVGFILLRDLDRLFGRVGPWLVLAWLGTTVAVMTGLVVSGLVDVALLAGRAHVPRRRGAAGGGRARVPPAGPARARQPSGPPVLRVRSLRKVYGLPGPVRATFRASSEFAAARARGRPRVRSGRRARAADAAGRGRRGARVPRACRCSGTSGGSSSGCSRRRSCRGWPSRSGARAGGPMLPGTVDPGGIEGWIVPLAPWTALATFAWITRASSARMSDRRRRSSPASSSVLLGTRTGRPAQRTAAGARGAGARVTHGALRHPRSLWRRWAARVGGFDLPVAPVRALAGVTFSIERGMIGVLGPNGAGKTTLLRQLAGVLDPTRGTIHLGGVRLGAIQRYLARWVGYLPQDAGTAWRDDAARVSVVLRRALRSAARRAARARRAPARGSGAHGEDRRADPGAVGRHAPARGRGADAAAAAAGHHRGRADRGARSARADPVPQPARPSGARSDRALLDARRRGRGRGVRAGARAGARAAAVRRGAAGAGRRGARPRVGAAHDCRCRARPARRRHCAEATPAADGTAVHRVLADAPPDDSARPLEASLEDGYLWLLHRPEHGATA